MMKNISKEVLKHVMTEFSQIQLLDVRTAIETYQGMIPNAQHIDYLLPSFEKRIEELDKNQTYYVYCRRGNRSEQACRRMEKLGFDHVYNLSGGIHVWDGELMKPDR